MISVHTHLISSLQHSDKWIRVQAAAAIGKTGNKEVALHLLPLL